MIPQQLIERKRNGEELSSWDLRDFLQEYRDGSVSEAQMAALLMAVYFQGLSTRELATLVDTMLHSGRVLDLSTLRGPRIDKHSTGGVGDKVSLVLAPLAAAIGINVPMMSGRSLGHTGGTLDKLESIPGFETGLSLDRFEEVLRGIGCAMIGQTAEIAPLDKRLYALRDVTGTVASIPLITASIMSKKLAEGLTGLVLDVKVGSGAFLPDRADAELLARTMIGVGAEYDLPVRALLTAMDRPLGRAIGNALEVQEALDCLEGSGPDDLREVTLALVTEMQLIAGFEEDPTFARDRAVSVLDDGRAREAFLRMVMAQGGDPLALIEGRALPTAPRIETVTADRRGVVDQVEPRALGYGIIQLGGGRTHPDQDVDPRVGFVLHVTPGDLVHAGDELVTIHAASEEGLTAAREVVRTAISIADAGAAVDQLPLIVGRLP